MREVKLKYLARAGYDETHTCAVDIIHGFPYFFDRFNQPYATSDLEEIKKMAVSRDDVVRGGDYEDDYDYVDWEIRSDVGLRQTPSSAHIITLMDSQAKEGWEKHLLENDYRKVSSFQNLREGHTIHMYVWAAEFADSPEEYTMELYEQ